MNAHEALSVLKANEETLRAQGVRSLSIFGSVARGQNQPDSDIDLAVELEAEMSLLDFVGVKLALEDILSVPVDLVAEPAERKDLQASIDRDRVRAFQGLESLE